MIKPVIVCIAKYEEQYIEQFVKYHLDIGFDKIYIYDNEDVPKYKDLLVDYSDKIIVNHLPFNNYYEPVQFIALEHFLLNYLNNDDITHVAHIDIDEYIVLKKHKNIIDFIKEYFVGDCAGICMNWRFFGLSSNNINKYTLNPKIPLALRFIECDEFGDKHIKTLFDKKHFESWTWSPHHIKPKNGYHIKSTNGKIVDGPYNENIDCSVIQLNHYKCKSFEEYKYTHSRGRCDILPNDEDQNESCLQRYDRHNKYESEDLTLFDYYSGLIEPFHIFD